MMDMRFLSGIVVVIFSSKLLVHVAIPIDASSNKVNFIDECMEELGLKEPYLHLNKSYLMALVGKLEAKHNKIVGNLERERDQIATNLERERDQIATNLERERDQIATNLEHERDKITTNFTNFVKNLVENLEHKHRLTIVNLTNEHRQIVENLNNTIGHVEISKIFFQTLLGIRKLVEKFEKYWYPRDFPDTNNRYLKWIVILKLSNKESACFLRSILRDENMTVENFAELMCDLYGDESEILHKGIDVPNVPFDVLETALNENQVHIDSNIRRVIKMLLNVNTKEANKEKDACVEGIKNTRCIQMSHVKRDFVQMPTKDIRSFFKAVQAKDAIMSICETNVSYSEGLHTGTFIVEFSEGINAVAGLLDNCVSISQFKIGLSLVSCTDGLKKCHPDRISNLYPKTTKSRTQQKENSSIRTPELRSN